MIFRTDKRYWKARAANALAVWAYRLECIAAKLVENEEYFTKLQILGRQPYP